MNDINESTLSGVVYKISETEDPYVIELEEYKTPDVSISSTEYQLETLNELYEEILMKLDIFLKLTKVEKSRHAKIIRDNLEYFLTNLKNNVDLTSRSTLNYEIEYLDFDEEFFPHIGMSESVAKKLWDNEFDEWWNDL